MGVFMFENLQILAAELFLFRTINGAEIPGGYCYWVLGYFCFVTLFAYALCSLLKSLLMWEFSIGYMVRCLLLFLVLLFVPFTFFRLIMVPSWASNAYSDLVDGQNYARSEKHKCLENVYIQTDESGNFRETIKKRKEQCNSYFNQLWNENDAKIKLIFELETKKLGKNNKIEYEKLK